MSNGIQNAVILGAACVLVGGCEGTMPPAPPADMGYLTPDLPDQGPPQKMGCVEIVQCVSDCAGDSSCRTNCVAQGTSEAQQKYNPLLQCFASATDGACAASCAEPSSDPCQACVQPACKAEMDTCAGIGGPPVAGFGEACDPLAEQSRCQPGLTCEPVNVPERGFCTKTCTNPGEFCDGAAEGQLAACVLTYDEDPATYCGFMCLLTDSSGGTKSFQCPTALTCGEEDPPGSGQKLCNP